MIMDFKDLCHARYSVRAFKPDAIPGRENGIYQRNARAWLPRPSTGSRGNSSSSPAKTTAHACSNVTTRNGSARLRLISWSAKTTGRPGHGGMTRKPCRHRRGHRHRTFVPGSSRTGIGHLLGVQLPRATLPRTFQTARRVVSGGHHPHRLSGHTGHP